MSTPVADPLVSLIAEYRLQVAKADAAALGHDGEAGVAATTFGPAMDRLCKTPPAPTSLAGVAEAIRLAIDDQTFIDQIGEQPLRACLAYLDEVLEPSREARP